MLSVFYAFIRNANRTDGHKQLEKRRASYRSRVSAYGDAAVVCKPDKSHCCPVAPTTSISSQLSGPKTD
jgi:hypothetical protein